MNWKIYVVFGFLCWILLGLNTTDELTIEEQEYCEMVGIWNEFGDGYGWPDYRGIYIEMCEPDKR